MEINIRMGVVGLVERLNAPYEPAVRLEWAQRTDWRLYMCSSRL